MLSRAYALASGFFSSLSQRTSSARTRARSASLRGIGSSLPMQLGQFHAQLVDLRQRIDIDIGDEGADAMPAFQQAFAFQAGEHAADRRARNMELARQLFFAQAFAGLVFEQADAVADRLVDPLEPLPRHAERALEVFVIRGHTASSTARRNCWVRSFFGAANSSFGDALLADLALVEEADSVGEFLREAHLMRDHQHGQVVFAAQLADDLQHLAAQFGVERGGNLIKQHDLGPHGKRTGDGDPLLLAAGKLGGIVAFLLAQPDQVEQVRPRAPPLPASAGQAPSSAPRCSCPAPSYAGTD